jgi:hypothetical protein
MKHLDDLKTLDPATDDIDPHGPRARATLERILATDPAYAPRPRRTRPKRVRVAVATSAVAIAAAAVFVPHDGPGLSGDQAYATWTAQPSGMSAKERAKAVKECRKSLKGMGPYDDTIEHAGTAMAERRGDWALVILVSHDEFEAQCMTNVNPRNRQSYGLIGGPGRPDLGPRQLAPSEMGTSGGGNFGYLTSAVGRAGSDIVAMTYNSPVRGRVEATVSNGYFAFWVPGSEFDGLHPVPVQVTYRDGRTATVKLSP